MTIHETARFLELLDLLTADEGDTVTFVNDNPDFCAGPNCVVFTERAFGMQERFTGETRLACLEAAYKAHEGRA